jgi:hypothetical protein
MWIPGSGAFGWKEILSGVGVEGSVGYGQPIASGDKRVFGVPIIRNFLNEGIDERLGLFSTV